jgi:hypothetical protein
MENENSGQGPDSRTGDQVGQETDPTKIVQGQSADSPTGEKGKGAGNEDVTEKDFIEIEGKKYYRSFDSHPEWQELKTARDSFNDLLGKNGYKDADELMADLQTGVNLQNIVGDRNAEELVEAANKWAQAEEYWAEQEARQQHQGESAEDRAVRLERENAELKKTRQAEKERLVAQKESEAALQKFGNEVNSAIDEAKLGSDEANIAKLFLGVDNPMDNVDVSDKRAMRVAINKGMKQFTGFVQAIKQAAIDEYATGQSKITPIAKGEGADTSIKSEAKFTVKEGETAEAAMGRANSELIEAIMKAQQA